MSKMSEKKWFLNGKIEKLTKIDEKWSKNSENHEKWQKNSDQISHKELTPSKCLPWEWATVRKRGQKRALSLRYPTRNWKTRKNSKKSCFHKNRQKVKKWQKPENQKSEKMIKIKKCKSEKMIKIKIMKKWQKKCQKMTPPEKGQNVT